MWLTDLELIIAPFLSTTVLEVGKVPIRNHEH